MSHNYTLVAGDTDGIAFRKPDGTKFTDEERKAVLDGLNALMEPLIRWEDDGVFKRQIVVKAKNYVLQDEKGKVKIKGAALKATSKEKALRQFIHEVIDLLLKDKKDRIYELYQSYAQKILTISDITDWCMKKTVTKAVLEPKRPQEQNVLNALSGTSYNEGDKVFVFYLSQDELSLRDRFTGTYCVARLLGKLNDSINIFGPAKKKRPTDSLGKPVLDTDMFPDFNLERNKDILGLETKKQKKAKLTVKSEQVNPPTDVKLTRKTIPESFWKR